MLEVTIASSFIMFFAVVLTLHRFASIKLMFGYAAAVDVSITVLLFVAMNGTLGGELIATLAGLLLALFLTIGRYCFGYSKIRWIKHIGFTVIDIPSPLKRNVKGKYHAYQSRFHRPA
jgi:hypothetical protein